MNQNMKYRLVITEYTTLKGFGLNCSFEREYDTDESVKNALNRCKDNLSESLPGSHIQCNGAMGFMIIDDSTGLVLTSIMTHVYLIDEDKKEYSYRGHKITTEFDPEICKDFLLIHRLDGRPYLYRSTLMGALDAIDWICCTIENASSARLRLALDDTNKKKEGN